MSLRPASLLALFCLGSLACSSSSFEVAASDPDAAPADGGTGGDTGASSDAPDTDVPDGVEPGDTGPLPDAVGSDGATCAPLTGNPSTIFVDGRTKRASIGSADCPAKTIRDALAILGTLPTGDHVIKVAGGTVEAPVVYAETGVVLVKARTILKGDGAGRVVVTGGGPCGGTSSSSCVVVLEGNGAVESLTIDAKGPRVGLAMTPAAFTGSAAKDVIVTGTAGNTNPAVYVQGAGNADLADVRVVDNQGPGVLVAQVFRLKVQSLSGGTRSVFDRNLAGITMQGGILEVSGADTRKNVTHGVAILSTSAGTHVLEDLVTKDNGANGVIVEGGANLKMRRSTLVANRIGLNFRFGGLNALDLGRTTDPGKNVFAGPSAYNKYAGICLPTARAANEPAHDNYWLACGPTALPLADGESCEGLSGYQDVRFRPIAAGSKPPLDFGDCTVGP